MARLSGQKAEINHLPATTLPVIANSMIGELTMILSTFYDKEKKKSYNHCKCACGILFIRRKESNNHSKCKRCSCAAGGRKGRTHGLNNRNSRIHVTWQNMLRRCGTESNRKYEAYGGAGITVCEEWLGFVPFMTWALNSGYTDKLTIDRVDNDKGYSPDNCRFVDISTQNANKRKLAGRNKYIGVHKFKGKFAARVQWRKKIHNLGYFFNEEHAARVRDSYVIENGLPHTLNFNQ